jgi:hypothetical protein
MPARTVICPPERRFPPLLFPFSSLLFQPQKPTLTGSEIDDMAALYD